MFFIKSSVRHADRKLFPLQRGGEILFLSLRNCGGYGNITQMTFNCASHSFTCAAVTNKGS